MALIHEKIPLIAAEIGAIAKNRKNEQQGYRFRGIDDVFNAIHAPLIKHGVSTQCKVFDMKREDRQTQQGRPLIYTTLMLEVTYFAADGSCITVMTAGEAMDSGDKATNKAMSAALKYAHFLTFSIPTDTNGEFDTETPANGPDPRDSVLSKDPTTLFWQWVKGTNTEQSVAKEIVKQCGNDFDKALVELKKRVK